MEQKQSRFWRLMERGSEFTQSPKGFVALMLLAAVLLVSGIWVLYDSTQKELANQAKDATIQEQEAEIQRLNNWVNWKDENGVRIDRMKDFYGYADIYDIGGALRFRTDAQFREFCQEEYPWAVYPNEEWTAEEIIQSYYDTPEIWAYHEMGAFLGEYLTWTADYEHCFILDLDGPYAWETDWPELGSGWLVIDGVRTQMLDQETYPMDPQSLLTAYQMGEWDGMTRRSADGMTTVSVSSLFGKLDYRFQAWYYDESTDPAGLAFAGFDREARPWWREEDLPTELAELIAPELEQRGEWQPGLSEHHENLSTQIYVDLPYEVNSSEFINVEVMDNGLFGLTADAVYHYDDGELLGCWRREALSMADIGVQLLKPCSEPAAEYADDVAYFYDSERLYALRPNGETEVVLDEILIHPEDRYWNYIWGLDGDRLIRWSTKTQTVLSEGVLETDFSTLHLFRKADGWYIAPKFEKEVQYLGRGTPEEYVETYNILASGKKW